MTPFKLNVPSEAKHGVVTIGNFDGVHRGHQAMLSAVREIAKRDAQRSVVVTFDPHPVNVLNPELQLPRLTSISHRVDLLKRYGADDVVVLPVTSDLLKMSPQDFFSEIVMRQLRAVGVVEGTDFHFGKDRSGDTIELRRLCAASGISLTIIPAVQHNDQVISSTDIRQQLLQGDVANARQLLGHPHLIEGHVTKGAERGRTLGFPTANLTNIEVLIPDDGVYAGATTVDGQNFAVAMSIGPNPTFVDVDRKVECHLINFSGSLYGSDLRVQLLSRVRGLQAFGSKDKLVEQIRKDVTDCREVAVELTGRGIR